MVLITNLMVTSVSQIFIIAIKHIMIQREIKVNTTNIMLWQSNHFLASYFESSSEALLLRGLADLSLLEITDFFPERFIFFNRSFISSSSDESSSFTSFADVDRALLS